MPIYNFRCPKCGEQTEAIQKFSDAPPVHCETPMERAPAEASFAFTTKAGNIYMFSGARGKVTKGSKKPFEIGGPLGKGKKRATLGGKRYA